MIIHMGAIMHLCVCCAYMLYIHSNDNILPNILYMYR